MGIPWPGGYWLPVQVWNAPRTIHTGKYESNPARDRYPALTGDGLVRLCFPEGKQHRMHQTRTRAVLIGLVERQGDIEGYKSASTGRDRWQYLKTVTSHGVPTPHYQADGVLAWEGDCCIERDGKGWRIMPPDTHWIKVATAQGLQVADLLQNVS